MNKIKVPNTYVIIFAVLLLSAVSTWFIGDGEAQTWQVFSALYEGFSQQAGIIVFVLVIGGAFWVVNSTKAVDSGIMKFISRAKGLERFKVVNKLGVGNIVITLIMLLFGLFGAVFGMSEETIAFVAVVVPLAKSLGYNEYVGICMVYVAAHVGFAGAMLNPFTIGIAQDMSQLPLFSGIEYRTFCWFLLMAVAILFVLWYAKKNKTEAVNIEVEEQELIKAENQKENRIPAWICLGLISLILGLFSINYASDCVIKLGQDEISAPWLLWICTGAFIIASVFSLRNSVKMYILNMLLFTIVFLVVGVMGYGWYLPEICALFFALAISAGVSAGYNTDKIAVEFIAGAKDIFSTALIIGFAAGIIVILEDGNVIDTLLNSMASSLEGSGKISALASMYGIQTFFNIFIPSASAKAAVTMPIMAPFCDMLEVSRQSMVMAFQFGDGFTNMITPCSGVLLAALSVAKIPYEKWVKFIWKFILFIVIIGFLLLIPTVFMDLPGF